MRGIFRKHKTVSGLIKYQPKGEPSDWVAAAKTIVPNEKADVIVVMLGLNDRVDLVANFLVVRTMQEGDMTLFAAGRYLDRVTHNGRGWRFARKEVVLDSRQIDTLLAIPI